MPNPAPEGPPQGNDEILPVRQEGPPQGNNDILAPKPEKEKRKLQTEKKTPSE
ncbi:MAG: hypothetical protein JO061_10255 [Acidobacteriaceae bacterium]|nr:hypothetical protein [Acidobacteriaceae bacterium]